MASSTFYSLLSRVCDHLAVLLGRACKWETGKSVRKVLGGLSVALRCAANYLGHWARPPNEGRREGVIGGDCCSSLAKGILHFLPLEGVW